MAAPNTSPAALRALLDSSLPMFSPMIDDDTLATVAAKPASRLPSFRYAGPTLHRGVTTVLLGDAVHTVKPYFGLGANSALEDVVQLSEALDRHAVQDGKGVADKGVGEAIKDFSHRRAGGNVCMCT